MSNSKFGKFILFGALAGAAISLFDRATRQHMAKTTKDMAAEISYYSKNRDVLMSKIQEKKEKYQSVYEQLAGDASYIKQQVEELKALTPQVKEVVMNTKDAVVESKDEVKDIVQSAKEDITKK